MKYIYHAIDVDIFLMLKCSVLKTLNGFCRCTYYTPVACAPMRNSSTLFCIKFTPVVTKTLSITGNLGVLQLGTAGAFSTYGQLRVGRCALAWLLQ